MNKCPTCNQDYKGFKNQKSIDEYRISLLCQACQDEMFGEDNEPVANGHCPNCGKYYFSKENKYKPLCSEKCFLAFKAYLDEEHKC